MDIRPPPHHAQKRRALGGHGSLIRQFLASLGTTGETPVATRSNYLVNLTLLGVPPPPTLRIAKSLESKTWRDPAKVVFDLKRLRVVVFDSIELNCKIYFTWKRYLIRRE